MELKVKLLVLIGADLVAKASALRDTMPWDEVDDVVLTVMGAVWLARQTASIAVGCVRSLRRLRGGVSSQDFVSVGFAVSFMTNGEGSGWFSKM